MTATSPQTVMRLRAILRARKLEISPVQLDSLVDSLNAAVADYRSRRRVHAQDGSEAAKLFAEAVEDALDRLLRAIERRRLAVGTTDPVKRRHVVPLAPKTMFALRAAMWRSMLKQWQADARAEVAAWARRPGRPRDEARFMMECAVADALDRVAITPSTAKNGTFARVLREIIYPAVDITENVEHAVRAAVKALPEWRSLPEWSRRLPRARKPASKI